MKDPLKLPPLTKATAGAIKALKEGIATPDQQKLATLAIIELSGVNNITFTPDGMGGERVQNLLEGMRLVGHHWRTIIERSFEQLGIKE